MKRFFASLLIMCCALYYGAPVFAQVAKKIPADKQRAAQWQPAKGQYYFSHSLVYDYENKADQTKGTITIYLDPVSGGMCFKKENSFGKGGKDFDFVIGFPDGKYIFCGADENGKKMRINEAVGALKPGPDTKAQAREDFSTYWAATGNKRDDFGFESLEYNVSFATSENKDTVWLAKTPFNVYPLYGLEFVESAVAMPISFDYMHLLEPNQLVAEINSKDTILKLKSFGRDPQTVSTKGYTVFKTE
ncbi:hypothetical protein LZG74_15005 [Dyadobacter sp. CY327]|uniref:hypothetical protein n=1 Tax=Dyadobacter sp. CY327 TaxID=2907301 RepID=UPI001F227AAE|nr:hypothetical protein [Dyadobacter sp. CY327]MCE7071626.1 hypothetical protein [Dyadobacter sp. CY327]